MAFYYSDIRRFNLILRVVRFSGPMVLAKYVSCVLTNKILCLMSYVLCLQVCSTSLAGNLCPIKHSLRKRAEAYLWCFGNYSLIGFPEIHHIC